MKIRQILRLILFLPLIYYIYISQNYDNNINIRESINNRYTSEVLKFDKEGELTFNITKESWPFKDKLDNELLLVSLKFDSQINSDLSSLIFKTDAYSKDKSLNRFILHDYINNSDTTILKDCDISGGRYRIGLLSNFSYEDIIIKLKIIQPDSSLGYSNPRLLIESYRGSGEIYAFGILFVYFNNFILIISIICLIIYVLIGLKVEKNKPQLPTPYKRNAQ